MDLQVRDHLDAGLTGSDVLPGAPWGARSLRGLFQGGGPGPSERDERSVSERVDQPPRSWMNRGTPDCLHDMPYPDRAAQAARRCLRTDGMWLIKEIRVGETWQDNLAPGRRDVLRQSGGILSAARAV
jgi:hypothetical protein